MDRRTSSAVSSTPLAANRAIWQARTQRSRSPFFVIEGIRMAAYHSPCSLVGGRERIYVDFRLSRYWAPHDSPPHSLTPKARFGSGQRGSPIHPTVNVASIRWLASTGARPAGRRWSVVI